MVAGVLALARGLRPRLGLRPRDARQGHGSAGGQHATTIECVHGRGITPRRAAVEPTYPAACPTCDLPSSAPAPSVSRSRGPSGARGSSRSTSTLGRSAPPSPWWAPGTRFFSSPERIAICGLPLVTPTQEKATREEYLAYLRGVAAQLNLRVRTFERVGSIE